MSPPESPDVRARNPRGLERARALRIVDRMTLLIPCLLLLLVTAGPFDAPWRAWFAAGEAPGRELAWLQLQAAGWPAGFQETQDQLRHPLLAPHPPTGVLQMQRTDRDGLRYPFTVLVPDSYDPDQAYPVRVILHGSTRRGAWPPDGSHWRMTDPFRSEQAIVVFPAAWEDAMWWSQRQIDNLAAILDLLRSRYHIDTNRCTLSGVSDGGTGTFYHALRAPTPWAAFLPLIGHPWVLGNPEEGADGDLFAGNLMGRALCVVNGSADPLYPAAALEPYLDLFRRAGAVVQFTVKPGGHTVRWWPEEAASFSAFRAEHPRDALPDTLRWETDAPRRNGRASWVVIEEIGDGPAPDPDPFNTVLFPDLDPPTRAEAFPRTGPSGVVTVRREGNVVTIEARNVRRMRLLISPNEFDLSRPVRVILNGVSSSHDLVAAVEVLMRWALVDADPAMLFAAEIELEPGP